MTSTMLVAAKRCIAANWPVFEIMPGGKAPRHRNPHPPGSDERRTCRGECGLLGHGLYDATTDLMIATRWWTRRPDSNIAIATGTPGPDVVDFDVTDGKPGMATFERLRDAGLLRGAHAIVRTRSGGLHVYFDGTDQASGARGRHGIDFRSAKGYVLAPPSTVDGTPYRLMEHREPTGATVNWQTICDFLDPPRPSVTSYRRSSPRAADPFWLTEMLAEPVAVGTRSERFHALVGACRRTGLSEQDTIALLEPWCRDNAKYVGRVDREVARCWTKVEVASR